MEDKETEKCWNVFEKMYTLCVESEDEQEFFVNLGIYLRYFVNKSNLWQPFDVVLKREIKLQNTKKEELKKIVISETSKSFNSLKEKIKESNIDLNKYPSVKEAIDNYQLYLEGKMFISGDQTLNYSGQLNYIFIRMDGIEELKKIKESFIEYDENKEFISYRTSSSIVKYEEELRKIERIEQSNYPYVWERLSNFYQIYYKFEEEFDLAIKKGDGFWSLSGLGSANSDLTKIIKKEKQGERWGIFDWKEHKILLKRFNNLVFTAIKDPLCFDDNDNVSFTFEKLSNDNIKVGDNSLQRGMAKMFMYIHEKVGPTGGRVSISEIKDKMTEIYPDRAKSAVKYRQNVRKSINKLVEKFCKNPAKGMSLKIVEDEFVELTYEKNSI